MALCSPKTGSRSRWSNRAVRGILEGFSPDIIILETSGLANPCNLLEELGELTELVRFDVTVTVVDALNCEDSSRRYHIAAEQISAADVLILNKSDLVDERRLQAVRHRLRQLNPQAPLTVTSQGNVNPAMILDVDARPAPAGSDSSGLPRAVRDTPDPPRTHAHDHLWSRTIHLTRVLDHEAFLKAVASMPPSIFRVKGLIECSAPRQSLLFQYVAGRWELSPFADPKVRERFLTIIGRNDDTKPFAVVEDLIRNAETQVPIGLQMV
jgi:G3E family GTPase